MIIEHLEEFYRREAAARNKEPRNVFRASSAGYCERRLGYEKLGVQGDPLTPRRLSVFRHGTAIDGALKIDLQLALNDKFLNLDALRRNECEIEGVTVSFTPDGAFQNGGEAIGIVEIKTMSDYAFDRACKGEIDRSYLCQAWVYAYGTSFNPVVFICYRKETSHMVELVFDKNQKEKIVVQRYGNDALELAINEPLMLAEIKTPFDPSVEEEVRGKFKRLAELESVNDLAPGVRAIGPEVVKIQGKAKAIEAEAEYGPPEKVGGSWFTFHTPRKIAGFPCSYCPMIKKCLNAKLEITHGRPTWVIEDPEMVT